MGRPPSHLPECDELAQFSCQTRISARTHEDGSSHELAIFLQIAPHKERAHTVSEDKQGKLRVFPLQLLGDEMEIIHHSIETFLRREIAHESRLFTGLSVPAVIVCHHDEALFIEELSKTMVAPAVLCHTVCDLHYPKRMLHLVPAADKPQVSIIHLEKSVLHDLIPLPK